MATDAYTPIESQTLSTTSSLLSFSSFSGYTDLVLEVNDNMSGASAFKVQFNSDTSANYGFATLQGYSSGTGKSYRSTTNSPPYGSAFTNNFVFGDATNANSFTPNIIEIFNYANSTTYKTIHWRWGSSIQANGNGDLGFQIGVWRSISPITSIQVSPWNAVNFNAGSTFNLYGIKAAVEV